MRAAAGLAALLVAGCLGYPSTPEQRAPPGDPNALYAPNWDGESYFNPWERFDVGPLDLLRWAVTRNPYDKSGAPQVRLVSNEGRELAGRQNSAKLTWVGHATFAIHDGDDVVLTDPHFGGRALLPKRKFPPGLPLEAIPPDAFAVVSHNHYDHLDAYTVDRLPESVQWFVPLGLADWFRDRDRPNVVELGWWQSAQRGRWTITCLPSQHWSRRLGHGTNETLWCSWLLDSGDYRYYFAGDTGYFHGFREFGERFGPIDVAMLPIGAYEPRWFMRYQHMDPEEAYRAFRDLGARYMLPMHWGTFDLTDEPVDRAALELQRVVSEAGADPARSPILGIGEGWHLPERSEDEATPLQAVEIGLPPIPAPRGRGARGRRRPGVRARRPGALRRRG
jgi:N-acyl-phosphatidylethanolamine-hydrolysing phospholipase D